MGRERGFSRRGFLVGAAAAAETAIAGGSAWPQAGGTAQPGVSAGTVGVGSPEPIKLGLASYTFRNFTRAQLIGFMRELNVWWLNAKDAKDHLPADPAGGVQAVADYQSAGIRLHAVGTIYFQSATDEDIRSKFEYARRASVPVIVAGDPTPETLPRMEQFAQQYDIKIAIHNHGPEDKLWPSPSNVLKVIQGMDKRIGCCIDVGHTMRAGTDVVQAIHAVGPRVFNIHMKDLTDFHDEESQVAVGDGKMPVPQIFQALQAIHYPGYVDLEYEVHPNDPLPGVTRSFAYMHRVLAGIGQRR